MIVLRWLSIVMLAALLSVGCRKRVEPAPAPPPARSEPKQAETHVVRLVKVQFSEFDFSLTSAGEPMDIRITLLEDGKDVTATSGSQLLAGRRGERALDSPVEWLVRFDPHKNYQIVLTEQAPPGETGKRTFIPATPRLGYWPIGEGNGHLTFGAESYLEFSDTVAR
jgi:hypothetical protein